MLEARYGDMMQLLLTTLMVVLASYLLGCFSTAYYLVRWRTGQDIRTLNSGTAGARNVGRVLGKGGFAITFLGDALKGSLAVVLAHWLGLSPLGVMAALLAVVAGHLWPIQLGGKGGKGASTALGGVLVVDLWLGLAVLGVALVFVLLTRNFSRGGMIAMSLAPLLAWWRGLDAVLVVGMLILALLLLFAHRKNWLDGNVNHPSTEGTVS